MLIDFENHKINANIVSFSRQLTTWHCSQLLLRAVLLGASRCRSISPARRAHSSKPAARRSSGR